MAIFCFEGPSAIGKTTLCQSLENEFTIVPEVNLLFANEKNDSPWWYYEKQVERYQNCLSSNCHSILDGDIFQSLWYNWIYNYPQEFKSKSEIHNFYKTSLIEEKIKFPDLYILFECSIEELTRRKNSDTSRSRRNFGKHLKLIAPQKKYFEFLKKETEIKAEILEYESIEKAKKLTTEILSAHQDLTIDSLSSFKKIINWLEKQRPEKINKYQML